MQTRHAFGIVKVHQLKEGEEPGEVVRRRVCMLVGIDLLRLEEAEPVY